MRLILTYLKNHTLFIRLTYSKYIVWCYCFEIFYILLCDTCLCDCDCDMCDITLYSNHKFKKEK